MVLFLALYWVLSSATACVLLSIEPGLEGDIFSFKKGYRRKGALVWFLGWPFFLFIGLMLVVYAVLYKFWKWL